MTTTIINLYCGPGGGKSTTSAFLFYLLKSSGLNAEMVREYVKEWAWEGRVPSAFDQIYLLGKQVRKESMLLGKVDYVVTDCPVLIGSLYAQKFCPKVIKDGVVELSKGYYQYCADQGHKHIHVVLNRTKEYNPKGRYQTEEEAKKIDGELTDLIKDFGFDMIQSGTSEQELRNLFSCIVSNSG